MSVQNAVGEESVPSFVPRPVERLFFTRSQGAVLDPLVVWSVLAAVALALRRRLDVTPSELMGPALRWPLWVALLAGYAALTGTALLSFFGKLTSFFY